MVLGGMNKKKDIRLQYYILIFCVLACYYPALFFGFSSLDDGQYVLSNPHVLSGLSYENLVWAFKTLHASNWHPLTWVSLQIDNHFFGSDPMFMHLTNILIHLCNALLVFHVFSAWTGSQDKSWWVALIFGVHPIHVESVVWISERKDVLFLFFMLLSLKFYFMQRKSKGKKEYGLSLLFFSCSLMSKPMAVTFPLLILLLELWQGKLLDLCKDWRQCCSRAGKKIGYLAPFFSLSLLSGLITLFAQSQKTAIMSLESLPVHIRVLNSMQSSLTYLYKAVFPFPLAHFYPLQPEWLHDNAWIIVGSFACFLVISTFFARKHRAMAFGLAWFGMSLFLVIGLFQIGEQAYADRYAYLPNLGIYIALVWTLRAYIPKKNYFIGALMTFTVFLFIRNLNYSRVWVNPISLNDHTLSVVPHNALILGNQAIRLKERGYLIKARECLERALAIDRKTMYLYELCVLSLEEGNLNEAKSLIKELLEAAPDDVLTHFLAGHVYLKTGDEKSAESEFKLAVELSPCHEAAVYQYFNLLHNSGQCDLLLAFYDQNTIGCGHLRFEIMDIVAKCRLKKQCIH